ncbi:protein STRICTOSIDINE SYNTHASE-LIKE 10 [Vitis vinifera]|uniref:protein STRICTOSIDINE SYNTHASE-LIKE 10 n=1 Tax=Vitis vinifera TaxID=29760 RepID=UPI002882EF97|nr:protein STRICTOSIDINE SYNTHASE-LIKE 10 [Vitis vinifera]
MQAMGSGCGIMELWDDEQWLVQGGFMEIQRWWLNCEGCSGVVTWRWRLRWLCSNVGEERLHALKYNTLELPSGVSGPESIAFDCNGDGPYTGISDGKILKWQGSKHGWKEFAITSPFRIPKFCDGSLNPAMEQVCGRPLGLKFNEATCDLYIADAYFGLLVVGQNGGVAKQVAISAEGVPFRFTNALDIDQNTGVVYFTDTSTIFQRWAYAIVMQIGDKTGRLLKYDPRTKEVTVLLRGLSFSNGVALSEDKYFVLVTEMTAAKITRYWLQALKYNTLELPSGVSGPESIAFDCNGDGPYTGISDDAYFGLLVVRRNGGVAKQVAISAEGVPFRFTNALDIDQNTGVVYFTDTSTIFQRWDPPATPEFSPKVPGIEDLYRPLTPQGLKTQGHYPLR